MKFLSSFQDDHFVYITLEICRKKSMMELHKRRGPLTEPEVRYFMLQICEGIDYLHNEKSLIHRDLKVRPFLLVKLTFSFHFFNLTPIFACNCLHFSVSGNHNLTNKDLLSPCNANRLRNYLRKISKTYLG